MTENGHALAGALDAVGPHEEELSAFEDAQLWRGRRVSKHCQTSSVLARFALEPNPTHSGSLRTSSQRFLGEI